MISGGKRYPRQLIFFIRSVIVTTTGRDGKPTTRRDNACLGRHLGRLQVFARKSFAVYGGARRVENNLVGTVRLTIKARPRSYYAAAMPTARDLPLHYQRHRFSSGGGDQPCGLALFPVSP